MEAFSGDALRYKLKEFELVARGEDGAADPVPSENYSAWAKKA